MAEPKRFDISAAVIKQLGEDLITDEVTALIELVKNAYDADANYANVVVNTNNYLLESGLYFAKDNNFKVQPGYITIEDDGTGMGEVEIEKGWLTISLSSKRQMKKKGLVTPKKNRTPLGDKGLGRLSTQRLGHRLEMFTCKEHFNDEKNKTKSDSDPNSNKKSDPNIEYHVAFDWSDFKEDVTLRAVPVHYSAEKKDKPRTGTKLIVTGLRNPDVWVGKNQRRLVSGLAQLLFPFGETRPFSVYLTINGVRHDLETIAESLRDVAIGRFSFNFDGYKVKVGGKIKLTKLRGNDAEAYEQLVAPDLGGDFFAFLTNPQKKQLIPNIIYSGENGWFISFEQVLDLKSLKLETVLGEVANPGSFYGEIDEFTLRGADLDTLDDVFSKSAEYRDYVSEQSGIRIFRDGFGIRPYGFDGDDWLKLSSGQTSGRSWYGLRPKNVIGYIALSAKDNKQLKEKTDREGFIESPYSTNFFRIMEHIVHIINIDVYHRLRRAYNDFRAEKSNAAINLISPTEAFNEMRKVSTDTRIINDQLRELEPRVVSANEKVDEIVKRVEKEPLFSTPQEREISPLLKEINETLGQVRNLISQTKTLLHQAERLGNTANALQPKLDILEEQLSDFSELAGLGLTAEALSHEIHTVADRLAERTRRLNDILKKKQIIDSDIVAFTEYIYSAVSTLRKQLSHLAPSLRYVRERQDKINLGSFFRELQDFYAERLERAGIRLLLNEANNSFSIKMNKGKLTQVIDNIILNSEYWLREAIKKGDVDGAKITITIKNPFVLIEDNGYGVDPSIGLSMFQPFVTTKPKNEGRGLGLFIVKELLNASDCTISLRSDRNQFNRRYIFQLDFTGALHDPR